jgi:hypothetical protein
MWSSRSGGGFSFATTFFSTRADTASAASRTKLVSGLPSRVAALAIRMRSASDMRMVKVCRVLRSVARSSWVWLVLCTVYAVCWILPRRFPAKGSRDPA